MMQLIIYKGFDKKFLSRVEEKPLINTDIDTKLNVLMFDRNLKKKLSAALLSLDEGDEVWGTYEEYEFVKTYIDEAIKDDGLKLKIIINNLYPDYYPVPFVVTDNLAEEIIKNMESIQEKNSLEYERFINIYKGFIDIDGTYYGCFSNNEYDSDKEIPVIDYYSCLDIIDDGKERTQLDITINNDIESYLRTLERIKFRKPSKIGYKITNGQVSKRILRSLRAFCNNEGIILIKNNDKLPEEIEMEDKLIDVAKNILNIEGFEKFRTIKFYKNPDINNETENISQSRIIAEIIKQSDIAYAKTKQQEKNMTDKDYESINTVYQDIFITASTGAGKSIMFQIPAAYLGNKNHTLTIIIEPVKALMQDQKDKLIKQGYNKVETFNSDLITQVEKEKVLERVKNGEVDLLYLSPETLLSYSIQTLIGDRKIGLFIVDEAHIVTTWGVGFRPDYWYLGGYINRLRNQIQTSAGKKRITYNFPICAFTATAVNGGEDDTIEDTITSLYMENPIKFIGYVRRNDIKFDIKIRNTKKLPEKDYNKEKTEALSERISGWLKNEEKTIVYFPYASQVSDAELGVKEFTNIKRDKRIGTYTGRNIEDLSVEVFNAQKREAFSRFRNGEQLIMYATKAFGMGVDVNDVQNVYHYAISGNLSDYIQEIGRAARKTGMNGKAIMDYFYNDMSYTERLFGMSQIRQYQVTKVLYEIYQTYKNKKEARNFLISPNTFTYIFSGKKDDTSNDRSINKLKICLLMLEKDFRDKYNFPVLIARPQGIFTKAYVAIRRDKEKQVCKIGKYRDCFYFEENGRMQEQYEDGKCISDYGDIYKIDLKKVWEKFYKDMSFPQFKFWFFKQKSPDNNEKQIMPEVIDYIAPRQKINIETRHNLLLSELRDKILSDFEYIADKLHAKYRNSHFTADEFTNMIAERYTKPKARIIANTLFDLVDPDSRCIKRKYNASIEKNEYRVSNGNFKEYMRRSINRSTMIKILARENASSYSGFISTGLNDKVYVPLKLLSIFDYISYELIGGEEPEIFIRLNDPSKIKSIVDSDLDEKRSSGYRKTSYSNSYVRKARVKHERDVKVLRKFLTEIDSDEAKWDYIEQYFLGHDVLNEYDAEKSASMQRSHVNKVPMVKSIKVENSFSTIQLKQWSELDKFFDDDQKDFISKMREHDIPIPEYIATVLKKSKLGDYITMSWPSKDTLVCNEDVSADVVYKFENKGWHVFIINKIEYAKLKKVLE